MKILLVDDEDQIRNIVRMYLTREGYIIKEAANGNEALEIIDAEILLERCLFQRTISISVL